MSGGQLHHRQGQAGQEEAGGAAGGVGGPRDRAGEGGGVVAGAGRE